MSFLSSGSKNRQSLIATCFIQISSLPSSILKMEATCSSETSADFLRAVRHYILKDINLHKVQRSSKLLMVLASTVILVSGPVGTHALIYVRFKTIFVFENGASSLTRGRVGLSE
jgi:hypothetical protein